MIIDYQLDEFFDFVFEGQTGYVYSPTKDPLTDSFEQYFFKWPNERSVFIDHIKRLSPTHEVYYAPALYTRPDAKKESFLGTHFVWAEFDGIPAVNEKDVPEPSIKIKSSTDHHEHWYWRLENFITDQTIIENVSQRITYHLQADLGIWNSNRVLRPPGTIHHESGLTTKLLRWDPRPIGIKEFVGLPDVAIKILGEDDIHAIPPVIDVIAKYSFKDNPEDFAFFRAEKIIDKDGKKADRSAALTKLGHICIEMGMSNAETLSMLIHADNRWKKYSRRRDQKARLIAIINYCRAKHPVDPVKEEIDSPLRVYTYEEFRNTELKIDWIVKDFIHSKGLIVTFGPAGVGKSSLLLRFGESLATGAPFLKWQIEKPMKLLYVSMEMPYEELLHFVNIMNMNDNPLLKSNLLLMPLGLSIKLNSKIAQEHLNKVIENYQPDGIVFDSFGKAVGEDLGKEKLIFDVLDYVDTKLRQEYGCFVWFIHHPRKGQFGNRRPNKLDDMYGNTYLGNGSTNVFTLWKNGQYLDINCLKLRLAPEWTPFKVKRTPDLNYTVIKNGRVKEDESVFYQEDDTDGSI